MLSSPLFRVGDVVTSAPDLETQYIIADVSDVWSRDLYLLSEPYDVCRFDVTIFDGGRRIRRWLMVTDGSYLR